ncbi:pyruvate kinase-like [Aricia agestis]|uniref:pyruvate kinase-like n=1 Tax=Aricia agestis TaxID=91739 RepID=UPI001C20796A|nr:pyruvate kinase-like [Aricia agestis]
MALPWHIPLSALPQDLNVEKGNSFCDHYSRIDIHQNPRNELQTGMMCEIGECNRDPSTIQRLIASGMTVARLNLKDHEPDACSQLIQSIRQAVINYSIELDYVYPLALIVDVKGPDIVTGNLKGGPKNIIELIVNESIKLTTDSSWQDCGTVECLFIDYNHLTDLQCGDGIYIDSLRSGQIKLAITDIGEDSVNCTVTKGGIIGSKMTARIYKVPNEVESHKRISSTESLCNNHTPSQSFDNIKAQINWAVSADIDAIIVPNVKEIEDMRCVRDVLSDNGKHILVYASIDSLTGYDNFDTILLEADGVYVDRFVLCNDLPVEKIFIAQKVILAKCNNIGKPCIFKAVINEQVPTLCVTDIANLILDGADVLSFELHYDFPLKKHVSSFNDIRIAEHCLTAACVICKNAERVSEPLGKLKSGANNLGGPAKLIGLSAVDLAAYSKASAIICLTSSGRTAKIISHLRPNCVIVAITRACHTARQLRFWKGVQPLHYYEAPKPSWAMEVESRISAALDYCKSKRILCAGDPYVLVTGSRRGAGYCDSIKLLYASAKDTFFLE